MLLHKTERRLRQKGVTQFRLVPAKLALPLLQNATMEDEDDLHSLWAALLAAAMDPAGNEVHRKYVSILADLTGPDALVLRKIWEDWRAVDKKKTWGSSTVTYGPWRARY
jgi:Abortive infection alpha